MSEEEELYYDLLSYIATSARGCIDEPKLYGPLRLIETMEKLIKLLGDEESKEVYKDIESQIHENKYSVMNDEEEFVELLDEIVKKLVNAN